MELFTIDYTPERLVTKDLALAFVGCGGIGCAQARAAVDLGLRIVACCDPFPGRAEAFAGRFGVPHWFTDLESMLQVEEIDIVEIAIPPADRVDVVRAVVEAGRHIHIQKPFAHRFEDAVEMTRLADRGGVQISVYQTVRHYRGARAAYELIRRGALGEIFYLEARMFGNQDRTNDRWYRSIDDFLLIEWGAHHFDILRFWVGRPPVRVSTASRRLPGQAFHSDMLHVSTLDFGSAALGSVTATDASSTDTYDFTLRIEGSKGALRGRMEGPLEICTEGDRSTWVPVDLGPIAHGSDPFAAQLIETVNAVATGIPSKQSGYDNLWTVATYAAAARSSREESRWVSLSEFRVPRSLVEQEPASGQEASS